MITKQILDELRSTQQKPYFGSQAKEMFVNGCFNPENWNGGDGIIRQYCYDIEYSANRWEAFEVDWYVEDHLHSGDVIVQYAHFEDYNYVTVIVRGYDNDNRDSDWYIDQYLIQYYKSRGKTEKVLYNGNPIREDQYIVLLNMIETTGYKFNLENE